MTNLISSLSSISATLFAVASVLLIRNTMNNHIIQSIPNKQVVALTLIAHIIFTFVVVSNTVQTNGLNFSFFNILSLVSCTTVLLYIVAFFTKPVEVLGLIILPFATISILLQLINPEIVKISEASMGLQVHILLSLLAYSLLTISALQAIVLSIQNKLLKQRKTQGFIQSLPPYLSMEHLLFRIILSGFIILSVGILTGLLFLDDIFAQHLVHKTVLSLIAWLIYGTLLWGHYQFGWRGKKSITLTLSAFVFLMLSYFGSKFVSELILNIS